MRFAGHVSCMGEKKFVVSGFVKPEEKRSLRIPRRRWKDNIKMNLKQ